MSISRRPRFLYMFFIVVAGGCAVGPNFHRPAAPGDLGYTPTPLPDATTSAPVGGGDSQRFVVGQDIPYRWWEAFGSPAINAWVELAFRANPSVAAAQASLKQAEEMVYAQQGYFFPTVTADYNFERQKLAGNLSGSSAPGVQGNGTAITAVQSATPPYNQPLYYNFHTAQLTVGFTPDVFGVNRRKVESLDAQRKVQKFELAATYVSLASNVVAAAIEDGSTRAQIDAVREIIAANEKSLQVMRDKFRLGYAMRIDLANQELQLAQAQALLPVLVKQLEQNRDLLRALVGNMPDKDLAETVNFDALTLPAELPVSLPSKLIEQRPDIRAAEEQLHSANAEVGVAIGQMIPQFNITGAVGGTATQFSQMFKSGGPAGSRPVPKYRVAGLSKCRGHLACDHHRCRRPRRGVGGRTGRQDAARCDAPEGPRRLHRLSDRPCRLDGASTGHHQSGAGACRPLRGYGGPVSGARRRLVESRRRGSRGPHGGQSTAGKLIVGDRHRGLPQPAHSLHRG
jgi:NodT family efflux transporter outer membrane factor (OMF) lipoprotein